MNFKKFSLVLGVVLGLVLPATGELSSARADEAGAKASRKSSKRKTAKKRRRKRRAKKRRRRRARKTKICRRYKGKRRCKWVTKMSGHGVAKTRLRTEPLPRPSGDIWVYAVNFREEIKVNIYDQNGDLDDAALAQLDNNFRCRRTREARAVDPRLYEILSIIYDHFGKKRIELVSGFRNQRNQKSRHFHASAMDIRIPGVSTSELYEFASSLDGGGMGVGRYPTSHFVHVDFRAPGAKSYRWTDYSGPGKKRKKRKKRRKRKKRHNS